MIESRKSVISLYFPELTNGDVPILGILNRSSPTIRHE